LLRYCGRYKARAIQALLAMAIVSFATVALLFLLKKVIDDVLGAGADRVVLGTAALTDPELVRGAIERHGAERIVVALDVRDGRAVGEGWVDGAVGRPLEEALNDLGALGVGTFAVTAIARDGLLGGPDLELLTRCIARTPAAVIASGGIRSIADLEAVRAVGAAGAIVGRALYDGTLDLSAAVRRLAAPPA
jgi:phosphoribosylformimino-5-aminoimidazole carboxamide ribonucleotide (ProFAR) isomerase